MLPWVQLEGEQTQEEFEKGSWYLSMQRQSLCLEQARDNEDLLETMILGIY